jgi:hypothetical protein
MGTGLKLVLSSLDAGGSFRRNSCCAAAGLDIKSGVGLATTPAAAAGATAGATAAATAPVFSLLDDTRGDGLDLRLLSRGLLINPASLDVITSGVDALLADAEGALGGVEVAFADAVFISRCLASLESYFPAKKIFLTVYHTVFIFRIRICYTDDSEAVVHLKSTGPSKRKKRDP